jgi:molecular chaperone GrpE
MEASEKNQDRGNDGLRSAADSTGEVERLREELRQEHDSLLRSLADFDNYRRRVERDRLSAARSGKREMIFQLLDVMDDFDRALGHLGDAPAAVSQGVRALHRKILGVLEAQGVTPFDSAGESFDPHLHEALGTIKKDDVESGAVAEELQRGYRWGDEVLRPARVRVAE